MKIRPVILSGGAGTRLWPVSRQRQPKQFVPLLGEECLFSVTLRSVSDRAVFGAPMIVGNVEHKFLILDVLERLNIKDAIIVLEPMGRNTAAAAIIAALADEEADEDLLHLVMPSDHVITDQAAFRQAVLRAAESARTGTFVLFGIKPSYPETGYGYIMAGSPTVVPTVLRLDAFKEKPDEARARDLIHQGALWNSGIFLYAPKTLCAEAETLAPVYLEPCRAALKLGHMDLRCLILDSESYRTVPSEPFDRVIMEHTTHGAVVPCDMGWSDVGSWQALWQMAEKDDRHNMMSGPVVTHEVSRSYIRSDGPTVAVLGLDDVMVVATKDAVLVAPRARSQDVKSLVSAVEKTDHPTSAIEHPQVLRPWGSYEGIAAGSHFQVKHIVVRPGRSLSLQMHHHRAEHWIVVAGTAKVECGEMEKLIFPNQSIFIPQGTPHRLTNPGKIDLHLIEVQSGDYVGEDDIVRFEDVYGRVP